jgi:hypothetical protein
MRLLKQALAVLGTVVVIAVIALLVAPKTAHALVATLVQVANTSANPVPTQDTENPARSPFQKELDFLITDGTIAATASFAVPAGKALVIDFVSGAAFQPAGETMRNYEIITTVNGVDAVHSFAPGQITADAGGGTDQFTSQPAVIYADQGSIVSFIAVRAQATGLTSGSVTVSGHLVNAPQL